MMTKIYDVTSPYKSTKLMIMKCYIKNAVTSLFSQHVQLYSYHHIILIAYWIKFQRHLLPIDIKSALVDVVVRHQAQGTRHHLKNKDIVPICFTSPQSWANGRCGSNLKLMISEHMLQITVHEYFSWNCSQGMPQNIFDDKSTLVQAMAWYHQAKSHNLSQCWPRPLSP